MGQVSYLSLHSDPGHFHFNILEGSLTQECKTLLFTSSNLFLIPSVHPYFYYLKQFKTFFLVYLAFSRGCNKHFTYIHVIRNLDLQTGTPVSFVSCVDRHVLYHCTTTWENLAEDYMVK